MENFSYEARKIRLLFASAIMFLVCIFIFFVLWQNIKSPADAFFKYLIIPFIFWYAVLFISVAKEHISKIEFDTTDNSLKLFQYNGSTITIPFEQIRLIKFSLGSCVRYSSYTKIGIYTTNNQYYKITIPKLIAKNDELITKLSSQITFENKYTFLLMP